MEILQRGWTTKRLGREADRINLNPAWQRGPAWQPPRKALLIDSILRGMDIPKVYLRRLPPGGAFDYDAVDGQQRLRAIWEYRRGDFALEHPDGLPEIDEHPVQGLRFDRLPVDLRARFDDFVVNVTLIVRGSTDEITNLFARLQMGMALNPAELRNAMMGPLRNVIDTVARSHEFFLNCRIASARHKHQDYATHAFALAAAGGERNLKAPDLRFLVNEFGSGDVDRVLELSARVGEALNVLALANERLGFGLTQKWIFVDLCWLIMQRHAAGARVDPAKLADTFRAFELRRALHRGDPEALLRGPRTPPLDRHLYDYIQAFRLQAADRSSLVTRNRSLRAFCADVDAS